MRSIRKTALALLLLPAQAAEWSHTAAGAAFPILAIERSDTAAAAPQSIHSAERTDPPTGASLPIVIAHRGASGERPEHTLEAYALAIAQGADYIEPDLVSTKDSVLVARHENEIGSTTDVATRFPERRRTARIDGDTVTGWFTEDFTLAELKTLRAKERLSVRARTFDGQFQIPTFDEVLRLAAQRGRERGRTVGVYPETKHPTYFRSIGLPLEERLVSSLTRAGLNHIGAPVFVQSFEVGNLRRLRALTRVRLVQLINFSGAPPDVPGRAYTDMLTPAGLRAVRAYAVGIGVEKRLVIPLTAAGYPLSATPLVRDAHRAGLLVHVWTLRSDSTFLPAGWNGDARAEVRAFRAAGVDGLFTDFPRNAAQTLGR
jgi:glycerophosphoryl diester phosphodiesterase